MEELVICILATGWLSVAHRYSVIGLVATCNCVGTAIGSLVVATVETSPAEALLVRLLT